MKMEPSGNLAGPSLLHCKLCLVAGRFGEGRGEAVGARGPGTTPTFTVFLCLRLSKLKFALVPERWWGQQRRH